MSRPMTDSGAFKEAQRRWGKNGAVQSYPAGSGRGHLAGQHHVGRVVLGCMFEVLGQGKTWEEAFTAADHRGMP
jgi:hypothetical protein